MLNSLNFFNYQFIIVHDEEFDVMAPLIQPP